MLVLPAGGGVRYFPRIKDGERVLASAGKDASSTKEGAVWTGQIAAMTRSGTLDMHPLAAPQLSPVIEADAPGLGAAWWAIEESAGRGSVNWFPADVPVLLGQLDGGEGKSRDAGISIERDRLLVRIVGYGGRP
jgi:hypothetical protein